jgi:hypothetical protein
VPLVPTGALARKGLRGLMGLLALAARLASREPRALRGRKVLKEPRVPVVEAAWPT